jgi:hypothetical protein
MSRTAGRLRPSGESAPTGRADGGPPGCELSERGTRDEVPADVESEERAYELAAEMPWADQNSTEVWPILHESATDA